MPAWVQDPVMGRVSEAAEGSGAAWYEIATEGCEVPKPGLGPMFLPPSREPSTFSRTFDHLYTFWYYLHTCLQSAQTVCTKPQTAFYLSRTSSDQNLTNAAAVVLL